MQNQSNENKFALHENEAIPEQIVIEKTCFYTEAKNHNLEAEG